MRTLVRNQAHSPLDLRRSLRKLTPLCQYAFAPFSFSRRADVEPTPSKPRPAKEEKSKSKLSTVITATVVEVAEPASKKRKAASPSPAPVVVEILDNPTGATPALSLEEINKKRKLASDSPASSFSGSPAPGGKKGKQPGQRFQRIKDGDYEFHDERLKNNAFDAKVHPIGEVGVF